MEKIKIVELLACALFAYNTHATESNDVLFSVFGIEMQGSEMVERGILEKKIIECEYKVAPSTSASSIGSLGDLAERPNNFLKYDQDVYQLNISSSDGAIVRLKIENQESKTIISLIKVDQLKSYAYDCYDYSSCVDFVLDGGTSFPQDSEGKILSKPKIFKIMDSARIKVRKGMESRKSIVQAGQNINFFATSFDLEDNIVSAGNETRLEVFPALGIDPIIRSMFIRSSETTSPHYLCNSSYRASLLDGKLNANSADISIYRFEDIKINFDSSIIND